MNNVLWKSPKASTASVTLTAVHDGGNISASEEWPHADATPRHTFTMWNLRVLPEEVLTSNPMINDCCEILKFFYFLPSLLK